MTPSGLAAIISVLAALLLSPCASSAQDPRGLPPPLPGQDIGPLEKSANPITPENPLPRRLHFVLPFYPAEASGSGLGVTFTVKATLGQQGHVDEARVAGYRIDSPMSEAAIASLVQFRPAFTKAALDTVRQWLYDAPARPPVSFYVQLKFVPDAESSIVWHDASEPRTVETVIRTPPSPLQASAIRVGVSITQAKKIKDVKPVYPPLAASAKVSGIVIIEGTIDTSGRVAEARVIRSIPLLDQAALDAVQQWEYAPTLLDGVPTPIVMSMAVNFQLEQ